MASDNWRWRKVPLAIEIWGHPANCGNATAYPFVEQKVKIEITQAERDILSAWLDYLCEREQAGNSNVFWFDGNFIEPELYDYFRRFFSSLRAKLKGELVMPLTEGQQAAQELLNMGYPQAQCCGDVGGIIGDKITGQNLTEIRDVRCLRITGLVTFIIQAVEKIVAMHTATINGTPQSLAIVGLVGGITALAALVLSGGTVIIPAVAIIATITLLVEQYGLSILAMSQCWGYLHNYLIANKCELINLLWNSRSPDMAKSAVIGFFENKFQASNLANATQSKLLAKVGALALPNQLFEPLFDFATDLTLGGIECECQVCFPDKVLDGASYTKIDQLNINDTSQIVPARARWGDFATFDAQLSNVGGYRMDLISMQNGNMFELIDMRTDIEAVFDGFINTEGLSGYPIALDFNATQANNLGQPWIECDLYCLFRQGWQNIRAISISSTTPFSLKVFSGTW